MSFIAEPIGYTKTPYQQKFAIPRQPGLVPAAKGEIHLSGEANDINCVRGLERFSHIWLIFSFHQTREKGWKPTVRPPRLGGNEKMGVFATRSTFRPNGMGLTVAKLESMQQSDGQVIIHISGMDLLDGTPILDIKPYVPYSDAISHASGGFAHVPPPQMGVEFSEQVTDMLNGITRERPEFLELVTQVLSQDPRPAYQCSDDSDRKYHVQLWDIDIQWQVIKTTNLVTGLRRIEPAD